MSSKLPKGWKSVNLGDVAKVESGYAFKSGEFIRNGIPIVRINNLDKNGVNLDFNISYSSDFKQIDKYKIEFGDILIGMSGSIGKVSIYKNKCIALLNQRVGNVKPINQNELSKLYLYYFLRSEIFVREISKSANGCIIANISSKDICNVKFNVPDMQEQQKIVSILEIAENTIKKRIEQIEALDELVKSRFIEMFGDLKSNSNNWNILNFNEFAIIDTNMTKDFEIYKDYPHIGIDSIEKDTGNILEYKLVKDSSIKSGKYVFDDRHIIYSKIRPNLNKVALPNFKGLCSADAYPILCIQGIVNRNYLGYVLRSEFFLNYILAFSGRTNIPKVNKDQLKGFEMPTPPIELQNEFADFVNQVDKLKSKMETSLKELEDNFNSLMQKAFKGELF